MILDADTHISPVRFANSITAEELVGQMDKSGVDRALCWLQPLYTRETGPSLRYIYDSVQKYPGRLAGFGWADPHLGIEQGKDTIHRCIEEYGFKGVKLNGAQNSFYIDDKAMSLPLIEEIAKAGGILALHIGADAYDHTHPYRAAKIARLYPEMPILMVHMGGAGMPDVSAACIEMAEQHPSMHLIASNIGYLQAAKAIRALGAERVSFGSDTPFTNMHAEAAAFTAFLSDDFSEEEQALVMGRNMLRLLGMESEAALC